MKQFITYFIKYTLANTVKLDKIKVFGEETSNNSELHSDSLTVKRREVKSYEFHLGEQKLNRFVCRVKTIMRIHPCIKLRWHHVKDVLNQGVLFYLRKERALC